MFAVLAFVQSVMWLSQIADEVVALFQARSAVPCVAYHAAPHLICFRGLPLDVAAAQRPFLVAA